MKCVFSTKQHRSTRRNNSLHPAYLTSLVTRTNHNNIQTIGIYVRVSGQLTTPDRFSYHTGNSLRFTASSSNCHSYLILSLMLSCIELMFVNRCFSLIKRFKVQQYAAMQSEAM